MLIVVCNDASPGFKARKEHRDRDVGGIKHFLETDTTIFALSNVQSVRRKNIVTKASPTSRTHDEI